MKTVRRWLALVLAMAGCGLLPAQQMEVVTDFEEARSPLRVKFRAITGSRIGGLGYLLVDTKNRDARPHRLQLDYYTSTYDEGNVRLNGRVTLAGGRDESLFLPLPSLPGASGYFQGNGAGVGFREYFEVASDTSPSDAILFVTLKNERQAQVQREFRNEVQVVGPDRLPSDWALLSTFRVVLVDEAVVLGEGPQEVLRRYAAAGGIVVALGDQPLGAGPLRQQLAAQGQPMARTGFGLLAQAGSLADAAQQLPRPKPWQQDWAGVLPSQFVPGEIPGLGGVPVRVFLLVILLFTVAVGPVNFLILRRRKQQLLAVLTVPLLGFGTTAAMLGYGVFQDGLGTQGVVRSISILDQERHEVAASTSQTLFAGLGPAEVEAPVGTVVQSLASLLSPRYQSGLSALNYTLGRPVLGGQLLPSRTLTTIVTTQQQPERARLRFAMSGDRSILAAEDFVLRGPGMLVVRDLQGQHYEERDGQLLPCDEARAVVLVGEILGQYTDEERRARAVSGAANYRDLEQLHQQMSQQDPQARLSMVMGLGATGQASASPLQPGSYLGVFRVVPWLDNHGLEIDYHKQLHLVRGQLSSEDFVQ